MGIMFVVLTGGYQMSLNTAWDSMAGTVGYEVAVLVGQSHAVGSPRFDVHQQQAVLCQWGRVNSTDPKPHCPQQSVQMQHSVTLSGRARNSWSCFASISFGV